MSVTGTQLHRAFVVTAVWTLGLLLLGSVVHATGSSLACPDWPTCYGSLLPEMSGGVFWEHLHRLVAGGLIVIFGGATYLAGKDRGWGSWVFKACLVGVGLLLVQAVLGGLTVIFRLPDAVSTSHLLAAILFLGLAVVLALVTAPGWGRRERLQSPAAAQTVRSWSVVAAALVLLQSGVGAWVRHADAGMACPDIPLCLGEWVPPLETRAIALQFSHRALGVLVGLAVLGASVAVLRRTRLPGFRKAAWAGLVVVLAQIALGLISVTSALAVIPVSLHTLLAATLFGLLVAQATLAWEGPPARGSKEVPEEGGAGSAPELGSASSG